MPTAGAKARAAEFGTTIADTQNASGATGSTAYTSTLTGGGVACGIAFVAPLSGKVLILNNCQMSNSTAGQYQYCSIRVRTGATIGDGTDVLADSDDEAIIHNDNTVLADRYGVSRLLTGLTPGDSYNVQQRFKVGGGTGTFVRKHLIVIPQV